MSSLELQKTDFLIHLVLLGFSQLNFKYERHNKLYTILHRLLKHLSLVIEFFDLCKLFSVHSRTIFECINYFLLQDHNKKLLNTKHCGAFGSKSAQILACHIMLYNDKHNYVTAGMMDLYLVYVDLYL